MLNPNLKPNLSKSIIRPKIATTWNTKKVKWKGMYSYVNKYNCLIGNVNSSNMLYKIAYK